MGNRRTVYCLNQHQYVSFAYVAIVCYFKTNYMNFEQHFSNCVEPNWASQFREPVTVTLNITTINHVIIRGKNLGMLFTFTIKENEHSTAAFVSTPWIMWAIHMILGMVAYHWFRWCFPSQAKKSLTTKNAQRFCHMIRCIREAVTCKKKVKPFYNQFYNVSAPWHHCVSYFNFYSICFFYRLTDERDGSQQRLARRGKHLYDGNFKNCVWKKTHDSPCEGCPRRTLNDQGMSPYAMKWWTKTNSFLAIINR